MRTGPDGSVTVWCDECRTHSTDAGQLEGDSVHLRCDACGTHSHIPRIAPHEMIATLAEDEIEEQRGDAWVATKPPPGEWTIAVAVMWHRLDRASTQTNRRRRQAAMLDKWRDQADGS